MRRHSIFAASACVALIALLSTAISAAPPADTPLPPDARKLADATMVVSAGAGQPKSILNDMGIFWRVGLRAGQSVAVALVLPAAAPGEPVDVVPLDGGKLNIAPSSQLAVNGALAFTFTPGVQYGLYRVAVVRSGVHYQLEFWHQDPNHPNGSRAIVAAE